MIVTDTPLVVWKYRVGQSRVVKRQMLFSGAIALSPNARFAWVGCGSGCADLVDLSDGKDLFAGTGSDRLWAIPKNGLACSQDGSKVAAGFPTGEIKVWDVSALTKFSRPAAARRRFRRRRSTPTSTY